jgi:hypothetical protein
MRDALLGVSIGDSPTIFALLGAWSIVQLKKASPVQSNLLLDISKGHRIT